MTTLDRLAEDRGAPAYVRFDHGPEFIAFPVADWYRFNGTETVFIDPGSPWQNGWIESFNGRMRDEHLNGQLLDSLLETQVLTEDWRIDYNNPARTAGSRRSSSWRLGFTDNSHNSHSECISYWGPVIPAHGDQESLAGSTTVGSERSRYKSR